MGDVVCLDFLLHCYSMHNFNLFRLDPLYFIKSFDELGN